MNVYSTPCKDCVFATYGERETGEGLPVLTQAGCAAGRLEKFVTQGVEVTPAYDDEREFFVVQGLCNLHRNRKSPWAMRHPGRDRLGVAREEVASDVDVVLVMDGHTADQARRTVDSLLRQERLPLRVTVVVNQDGVSASEVRDFLPADWVVTLMMERLPDGSRVGRGRCIDLALHDSKAHFYAVFSPGFVVPPDFVSRIDSAVNDEMVRFSALEPNGAGEGLVVQNRAHAWLAGNAGATTHAGEAADDVLAKVRHVARVNGEEHMVKKVTDLCPSMAS